MKTMSPAGLVCAGCALLLLSGCLALGSANDKRDAGSSGDSTSYADKRLRQELDSQKILVAKLTAGLENQRELNRYLENDLRNTKEDLDYVEKQFIILEHRLMRSSDTKASAVAALAEAKLAYGKLLRENPSAAGMVTVAQAKNKIKQSNQMLQEKRYVAAIYFANRAVRLLTQNPYKRTILIVSAERANIRTGPGMKFDVVDQLEFGTVLVELDQKEDWYLIETKSGKEGWVHKSLLR